MMQVTKNPSPTISAESVTLTYAALTAMPMTENQIKPHRRPIRSARSKPIIEPSGPPAKISTDKPSELATPWPCFTKKVGTQLTKA
ncbi:hypothetical protein GALL_490540 [mine drainage metagenome]|uniref:Uncharacterized protein n=1 Tax=mine drainage metagenome TaxID=410659 RepID=A0A1J5PP46_9ZZZZ